MRYNPPLVRPALLARRVAFVLLLIGGFTVLHCDSKADEPTPQARGSIVGQVQDSAGNLYPGVAGEVTKVGYQLHVTTDAGGRFTAMPGDTGVYELGFTPPLATDFLTELPLRVTVRAGLETSATLTLQPRTLTPDLVLGSADIFGEVRDKDDKPPFAPATPLYARNVFDAPLGLLTPIKTPAGHHVTLAEWEAAQGSATVHCRGISATVTIDLAGMIPGGTYTLWCNFLNKPKQVGDPVNFGADVVRIDPLGSGTKNVVIADAAGHISATITHPSCILTTHPALVIVIDYHINGNTFGDAHIPDAEDVNQLLLYFQ